MYIDASIALNFISSKTFQHQESLLNAFLHEEALTQLPKKQFFNYFFYFNENVS